MGNVDNEGVTPVEEGQEAIAQAPPVMVSGLMAFPQSHSNIEGQHVVGYRIGNGTTLLVMTIGEATEEPEEAGMTAMLVSDADARLVQERHARKQLDMAWMCNLGRLGRFHDPMFTEIMEKDIWEGIISLPVPQEPCVLQDDEVEYRQHIKQEKIARAVRVEKELKQLREDMERDRAEQRAMEAAKVVEAARRDRRAGDMKVTA